MTVSPTRQPVTGAESFTAASPAFTDAPSFSHVRFIGAPCVSQRPPQLRMAGKVSLFIPSK